MSAPALFARDVVNESGRGDATEVPCRCYELGKSKKVGTARR